MADQRLDRIHYKAPGMGIAAMMRTGNQQVNTGIDKVGAVLGKFKQDTIDRNTDKALGEIQAVSSLDDLNAMFADGGKFNAGTLAGEDIDNDRIQALYAKQKGIITDKIAGNLFQEVQGKIANGEDTRSISNFIGTKGSELADQGVGAKQLTSILGSLQGTLRSQREETPEEKRARVSQAKYELGMADLDFQKNLLASKNAIEGYQKELETFDPYFNGDMFQKSGYKNAAEALFKDVKDKFLWKDFTYDEERTDLNDGIDDIYERYKNKGLSRADIEALAFNVGSRAGRDVDGNADIEVDNIISKMESLLEDDYKRYSTAKEALSLAQRKLQEDSDKFARQRLVAQLNAGI